MKRGLLSTIDWRLLAPVLILVILSLTTLFSINIAFFKAQFIFLLISFFAFLFFSHSHMRIIQSYMLPIYVVSFLFLLMILALGIETRGAVRWIEIFGFRIQFSEIVKPFLAISLSSFLSQAKKVSFKLFCLTFCFLGPIVLLIFLQPDLGNALIYVFVVFFVLAIYGFSWKYFLAAILPVAIVLPFLNQFLHGYQKDRLTTFINPGSDPLGTSYNAIQSMIAVGSGNFYGKGLGQGTQSGLRFLPERHTDFIFATITEGLGFVGGLVILLAFGFLLYRAYKIFLTAGDTFSRVFAIVSFLLILIQLFINIGMNIGLLPIVGVTLPFVSYGGSSLLANFILLGFLSALSQESEKEAVLEIG